MTAQEQVPSLLEGEGVVRVEIKGRYPGLLMHNIQSLPITSPKSGMKQKGEEKMCQHEIALDDPCATCAESMTYRDEAGNLAIPATNLYIMLVNTGKGKTSGKGNEKVYLSKHVASTVRIEPDFITLTEGGKPLRKFDVDSRYVRIQGRGRVIRHRPLLRSWTARFWLIYEKAAYAGGLAETLKDLFLIASRRVGILEYRPEHYGPFGRFDIVKWEEK